jgi:L-aspartate oxidase
VVANAISLRMAERAAGVDDHVYLDATHMGERFAERFPSITASCRAIGIDPATERIPVAPAAHYVCGGLRADLDGHTELAGLYAVGEVACTGVHGANRLASNSLTEGVVAGTRVGRDLAWELPELVDPESIDADGAAGLLPPELRAQVRSTMSRHVGVMRRPEGLAAATEALADIAEHVSRDVVPSRRAYEATNLLTVSAAVVEAARTRTESRGCHRRSDYTEPRPVWLTHLTERLDGDGVPRVIGRPEEA